MFLRGTGKMLQNNEIMDYLRLKNIFLELPGGITSVIIPVKISNVSITVFSSANLEEQKCILKPEFRNGEDFRIVCDIEKNPDEGNCYNCYFDDPLPQPLLVKVSELDTLCKNSNKRCEQRLEIGLENWQKFDMVRCDCNFTFNKHTVKTIISNASYHGVLLIGERSFAQIGELVTFNCAFNDCAISQKANIINAEIITQTYFKYSLHFIEPVSLYWIKKIDNFQKLQ